MGSDDEDINNWKLGPDNTDKIWKIFPPDSDFDARPIIGPGPYQSPTQSDAQSSIVRPIRPSPSLPIYVTNPMHISSNLEGIWPHASHNIAGDLASPVMENYLRSASTSNLNIQGRNDASSSRFIPMAPMISHTPPPPALPVPHSTINYPFQQTTQPQQGHAPRAEPVSSSQENIFGPSDFPALNTENYRESMRRGGRR